jgi:hypothetical protein
MAIAVTVFVIDPRRNNVPSLTGAPVSWLASPRLSLSTVPLRSNTA